MRLLFVTLIILITSSSFADNITLSSANELFNIGKKEQAKVIYEKLAFDGDKDAHYALSYKYALPIQESIYHYEQAAIRGHEDALKHYLDDVLFRVNNLTLAKPVKAREIYKKAKMSNPNIHLYDEKEIIKILNITAKSNDFDVNKFIKRYNIDTTNSQYTPYFVWKLAQEAATNGRFGKPNAKLVFDLVVRGGQVPAEYFEAVKATYKNLQNNKVDFNLCDFITSGMGMSYCSKQKELKNQIKIKNSIKNIKKKINSDNLSLFETAYNNTFDFIDDKAFLEEGHGGSGRNMWLSNSKINQKNNYIRLIYQVMNGYRYGSIVKLSTLDNKLNETYKKVIKRLEKETITNTMSYPITKEGIKKVEIKWIKYRDNNSKLFTILNPNSSLNDWQKYFTNQRIKQLQQILTY
ncbi:hypothetical protein CRU98_04910 [Arcobacter sp. CECT 8986]|uniref:lysozyme inhibitor LprI family protein n=1 Tax=Arcobacter sp. CECT 8986 TaxID=2044507 RepID=UPI001009A8C2|nr:lysozyme inhibitor LprI family protein [Arcobacter sp. CECT 8986]RXK00501.1 hypothetical protein CRU98_04910 [Arcobacter sp. CECT 8986]